MPADRKLDKQTIEDAFDAIAEMASQRGIVLDMAVYGGSCLVLASDIRAASEDVDAVYLNHQEQARKIVDSVTRRKRLPDGWMNQAAKQFAPPRGNPQPHLLQFQDYPRDGSALGLRIFTPAPEYLLAMKVLANRAPDDDKNLTDSTDAVALMKLTGINTYEKIVDLMEQCYPNIPGIVLPTVSGRMSAKIKGLVDEYNGANSASPTWIAGRGRPLAP
ncbi:hypothetical protein [Agrobacterium bohemicum]|uniref:Uncharacterized protein n=1 Tax=Agrobacterium bohemicum TaxID=2052828 RepID=A0A135P888_9HYPH|nr:hypothetical protein [Agrobacterium bohemicum]KXG87568.1 hypothetical protein ATO67_18125 [Agrobacterium bohemicum]